MFWTIYIIITMIVLMVCGALKAFDGHEIDPNDAIISFGIAIIWPMILALLTVMSPFFFTYWIVKQLKK